MCDMIFIQSSDDVWLMYGFESPLNAFCCRGGCDKLRNLMSRLILCVLPLHYPYSFLGTGVHIIKCQSWKENTPVIGSNHSALR